MKRFLKNIMFFFAFVAIIDLCVGVTGDYFQANAKGGDTRKTNDLVVRDQHDILIFGSSRACHHYNTPFLSDTLGMDVFNAGYDGNGVVLSCGLLSMVLERYQPKLIIFDVEPSFDIFNNAADNGNKRYINLLKPYFKNTVVASVIKGVSEEEYYKSYSGMMRYNTTIISKAFDYIGGHAVSNKGFVPMNGVYQGESKEHFKQTPTSIDEYKLDCLTNMLNMAKLKNVPIMLVASPKYGENNTDDLQTVITICKDSQTPFVDYYADSLFMKHKEWFNEPMHLNATGAKIFSSLLIENIRMYIKEVK